MRTKFLLYIVTYNKKEILLNLHNHNMWIKSFILERVFVKYKGITVKTDANKWNTICKNNVAICV